MKDSVGGTPTDATETVALPEKSLISGVSVGRKCAFNVPGEAAVSTIRGAPVQRAAPPWQNANIFGEGLGCAGGYS